MPHLATPIGTLTLTVGWPASTTLTRKSLAFFPGFRSCALLLSLASASLAASSFAIVKHLHRLRCRLCRPSVRGNRMGSTGSVGPVIRAALSTLLTGTSLLHRGAQ